MVFIPVYKYITYMALAKHIQNQKCPFVNRFYSHFTNPVLSSLFSTQEACNSVVHAFIFPNSRNISNKRHNSLKYVHIVYDNRNQG